MGGREVVVGGGGGGEDRVCVEEGRERGVAVPSRVRYAPE